MRKLTITIVVILAAAIIFSVNSSKKIKARAKDVAAMRIPYETAYTLHNFAAVYEFPYAELLALYAVDNRFITMKASEKKYVVNYEKLKKRYGAKNLEPYVSLFKTIFEEMEIFPISDDYKSYMFGDNFRLAQNKNHLGTDIIDRENLVGRLKVFSMTAGVVENIGFNENDGWFVGIRASSGNYYFYANFDSLETFLKEGKEVAAGQVLGFMGSSGKNESKHGLPVKLHMGIRMKAKFFKEETWINPYIFLRLLENGI